MSLAKRGYQLYHEIVFQKFKQDIPEVILNLINDERNGIDIDREMVFQAIQSFVKIGEHITKKENYEEEHLSEYRTSFEEKFLEETRAYYQTKTQEWLKLSTSEYLKIAEKRLKDEEARLVNYVPRSTAPKLIKVVLQELLMEHQIDLLDKKTGLISFFEAMVGTRMEEAKADLSRLYLLYIDLQEEGIHPIATRMKEYISRVGKQLVERSRNDADSNNTEKEVKFIKNLLKLHTKFLGIVRNQFKNHTRCENALRMGFKGFINEETYVAIRLAGYSHTVLKRGGKEKIPNSLNKTLDNIVKLYEYIHDKDYFELAYQRFLSERLINGMSESNESEKSMIGKLKLVGGNAIWCRKLENMFKDLETSKYIIKQFSEMKQDSDEDLQFDCRICTFGQWENDQLDILPMPDQVDGISKAFKTFYENKFSGRTLDYRLDKGRVELRVPFRSTGTKILVISPHQMAILLKFNVHTIWEHSALQSETMIPESSNEFQSALIALAHPKMKVLCKRPNSKECKPGDKYKLNEKFKAMRNRVIVPAFKLKAKKRESNIQMTSQIMTLRAHQADAAIVRTMKTRKELDHKDLMSEVIRQLTQFQATPAMLKKRIATLLDQEYIKRDPNIRGRYIYQA